MGGQGVVMKGGGGVQGEQRVEHWEEGGLGV